MPVIKLGNTHTKVPLCIAGTDKTPEIEKLPVTLPTVDDLIKAENAAAGGGETLGSETVLLEKPLADEPSDSGQSISDYFTQGLQWLLSQKEKL